MHPDEPDETMSQIEQTQARLRDSIEEVKRLAEESQQLLDRHKKELNRGTEA